MSRVAALQRSRDLILRQLGLDNDPCAPREIAVALAVRDGIPIRVALERLGVDLAPLQNPPVAFDDIRPGLRFRLEGAVWTRATLDRAVAMTVDRTARQTLVAAYVRGTRRGGSPTAFRWISESGEPAPGAECVAVRVDLDTPVVAYVSPRPTLGSSPL